MNNKARLLALGLVLGGGIGLIIGFATDNVGVNIALGGGIGLVLGLGLGALLDARTSS
jgi:hypothetical protein